MRLTEVDLQLVREPFVRPFGFKGSSFHEKWCPVVRIVDESGAEAIGVGGLTPLWSDARVFLAHTEIGANALQLSVLEEALALIKDKPFADPFELHDSIVADVHKAASRLTGLPDLRMTFTLVALSALDYAVWLLHARLNGISEFDALIPEGYRSYLADRHPGVALAPAVGYTLPEEELIVLLEAGAHVLKIKIGHAGSEEEMVTQDRAWLDRIHGFAASYETEKTESGKVLYYLDANGRYGETASMARLLDHAEQQGYLDRIILIEEPFSRPNELSVDQLPACFAGDESVESVADVRTRIEQGYGAFAIKTAGKTLTRCFRMLKAALDSKDSKEGKIHCFVADNACVPIMVEWNKNLAARLPAFPVLQGGLLESNGPENYGHWARMLGDYASPNGENSWLRPQEGAFRLEQDYYRSSGGIFSTPDVYSKLFQHGK